MSPLSIPQPGTGLNPMSGYGSVRTGNLAQPKLSDSDMLRVGNAEGRKAVVEKKSRELEPKLIPEATALKLSRDALESERQTELKRIEALPEGDRLTGEGTNVFAMRAGNTGVSQIKPKKPLPIPPAPTAKDLALERSNEEVVREMVDLIYRGQQPQRSKLKGLAQTAASALTFGTLGGEDMKDPLKQAQYVIDPLTGDEKVARALTTVGVSLVPYTVTARMVGSAARQVGFLNNLYQNNRFVYGALVENLGQELIEGTVRKGTGQEYGKAQFFQGLVMGGLFEGGFAGMRSLEGVTHQDILKQLNKIAENVAAEKGSYPSMNEVVEYAFKHDLKMPNGQTFQHVFRDSRLAYYRGKQKGTPGMDFPFEPPRPSGDGLNRQGPEVEKVESMLSEEFPGPRMVPGRELTTAESPRDANGVPFPEKEIDDLNDANIMTKQELTSDEIAQMFEKASAWEKAKGLPSRMWNSRKVTLGRLLDAGWLSRQGAEGKRITEMIDAADQERAISIGNAMNSGYPVLKALKTPEQAVRAYDMISGKIKPESAEDQAFMSWWDGVWRDIGQKASDAGLEIKDSDGGTRPFSQVFQEAQQRGTFTPRFVDYDKVQEFLEKLGKAPKDKKEQWLTHMKNLIEGNSGGRMKFANLVEVERFFQKKSTRPTSSYGHLERAREAEDLPEEFYTKDVRKILPEYIQGSYARLADARNLGPKQEMVNDILQKYRDQAVMKHGPKEGEQMYSDMLEYVNRVTGLEALTQKGAFNPGLQKLSKVARTYQVITKMSLSSISNIGDVVKPFVRTDWVSALKAIGQEFSPSKATRDMSTARAARSGAIEHNLRSLAEDLGDTQFTEKFLRWTGFEYTERKIRQLNANAAINYAGTLAKQLKRSLDKVGGDIEKMDNPFAYRRLAQLVEDPEAVIRRGYLLDAEKDVAGYRGIADTQPIRRLDLPYYWQSPTGRVMTQFKSFAYKQMTFMKKHIIDEARQGNVKPLISFLVLGQLVGEPVADLKAFVRGRSRDENIGRRIIDNYMTIGGMGLATDFLSNIQYGSMGGGFLRFIAGPTLQDTGDWLERIASPKRAERVTKKALYSVPVVGPAAANAAFPAKQVYRARTAPILDDILDIFNEEEKEGRSPTRESKPRPSGRSSSRRPRR